MLRKLQQVRQSIREMLQVSGGRGMDRLVKSELSGTMVSISSEEWRHECEVSFLLGLPELMRDEILDGVAGSADREEAGIKGARGDVAVSALRADIERLADIRRRGSSKSR